MNNINASANFFEKNSPFLIFNRQQWADLQKSLPISITKQELAPLIGFNEALSLEEVSTIYSPLIRLIQDDFQSSLSRYDVLCHFLGKNMPKVPYIIGIAGSVSVGKSTTARILQALLASGEKKKKVSLITTDGFLYPLATLQAKNLLQKKGFPVSYDIARLVRFLAEIKSGKPEVYAPIYSHITYDILPNQFDVITQPDILILEGLNVLQPPTANQKLAVSDFVDFSIYVDAEEHLLKSWYVARFLQFRQSAFNNPDSYFKAYAKLSEEEATATAEKIWEEINGLNLRKNILPTRERANLILTKGENHTIESVKLRKQTSRKLYQ